MSHDFVGHQESACIVFLLMVNRFKARNAFHFSQCLLLYH